MDFLEARCWLHNINYHLCGELPRRILLSRVPLVWLNSFLFCFFGRLQQAWFCWAARWTSFCILGIRIIGNGGLLEIQLTVSTYLSELILDIVYFHKVCNSVPCICFSCFLFSLLFQKFLLLSIYSIPYLSQKSMLALGISYLAFIQC